MATIGVTSRVDSTSTGTRVPFSSYGSADPAFDPDDFTSAFEIFGSSPKILFDSTATAGLVGQIMPNSSGDRYVRVGWYVTVDGNAYVPLDGPISAPRSIDRNTQTAALSALAYGASKLGPSLHGTPTGRKPITVGLFFRDDEGLVTTVPILSNGALLETERTVGSIPVDSLGVQDQNAILALKRTTHQVPEGSNRQRHVIISALAQAAGASSSEISLPSDMGVALKAIDLDKGNAVDLAQALAEVPGYRLLRGRDGTFTAVPYRPEVPFSRIDWVYGPADWCESIGGNDTSYVLRPSTVPYDYVELRASKQVTRGDGACGIETAILQSDAVTLSPAPHFLPFIQTIIGSLNSTGEDYDEILGNERTVSTTVYKRSEQCGAVVSELTETYRYRNLEAARFLMSADALPTVTTYFEGVYVDDAGNAFYYESDVWLWDSREEVTYTYDANDFLVSKVTNRWGLYNPKVALKERAAVNDSWDTAQAPGAPTGYRQLGNGHGVKQLRESELLVESISETFAIENGYVTSQSRSRSGYGRRPGGLFLYRDGEYGQEEETFQELEREDVRYIQIKADPPLSRVERVKKSIEAPTANEVDRTFETRAQAPPAAQKGPVGFASGADFRADRLDHTEIQASCTISGLSQDRFTQQLIAGSVEYAESVSELRAMCRRLALIGASGRITFTAPPNPFVDPGHVLRFTGRPGESVDEVGIVISNQTVEAGGVPFSQITIETYPPITVSFA